MVLKPSQTGGGYSKDDAADQYEHQGIDE